jgi:hypothetical protein
LPLAYISTFHAYTVVFYRDIYIQSFVLTDRLGTPGAAGVSAIFFLKISNALFPGKFGING